MTCACLYLGPSYLPVYWFCHLHSLWGCLAFVGFPSGFGLAGLGPCPLGFLFAVLVGFSLGCFHLRCGLGALASRCHGSFVPVGPSLSVFVACFCCGWLLLLLQLLWLPPHSALSFLGEFRSKFPHSNALLAGFWGQVQSKGPKEARSPGSFRSMQCTALASLRPHVFMNEQAQAALGELQAQLVRSCWDSRKWIKLFRNIQIFVWSRCLLVMGWLLWLCAGTLEYTAHLLHFVTCCFRFYLCCALRLRADEVDAAGEDMLHLSVWIQQGYQY